MIRRGFGEKNARWIRRAFFVGALSLVACGRVSDEERREFERISRAIDVLRDAPNEYKSKRIQPLRELTCRRFCALRDRCISAYETHIKALDLIARARLKPILQQEELDRAEHELLRAKEAATACAAEQARVGRDVLP